MTINHRDQPGLYIIGGLDEVFTQLEDDQVTLQTMMASRYISAVQVRVDYWEKRLALLSETLDEWVACQARSATRINCLYAAGQVRRDASVWGG